MRGTRGDTRGMRELRGRPAYARPAVPRRSRRLLALALLEIAAIALLGLLVAGLLRSHAEILRLLHHLGADLDLPGAAPGPAPRADLPVVDLTQPGALGPVTGESPEGDA